MGENHTYKDRYKYKGQIRFLSSDKRLNDGFAWAKKQALVYAHEGDPVGDWYEAALPGRQAFCMRDVAHHALGAQALGLALHTRNMLLRFAQSIAQSRDFCSFWEICSAYAPAPVDYTSDDDFWYNLPANYDVLDACWRMYCWTGDDTYLQCTDFTRFYDLTAHAYTALWDRDGDGIVERDQTGGRRGIPSYNENIGHRRATQMVDLVAIQARGFFSYAQLCRYRGETALADAFHDKALHINDVLDSVWWNGDAQAFFTARLADGRLVCDEGPMAAPAYFDAVRDPAKLGALLDQLAALDPRQVQVESLSHFPETFYRHGQSQRGYDWLCSLTDPHLARREYPEASFAAVGCYVAGLMGLEAFAPSGLVITRPRLPDGCTWAQLEDCPVFGGCLDVKYDSVAATLSNRTGREILWRIPAREGAPQDDRTITVPDGASHTLTLEEGWF